MGDGFIAEFGSVVDAVTFAVAMQRAIPERQSGTAVERRLIFRVGINLGDVVVEADDLLGDGVDVAARLEQHCTPVGIMISGTAYDQLQGKLGLPLDFTGEQRVKNISRPVRTYVARLDGSGPGWSRKLPRYGKRARPAIAAALWLAGFGGIQPALTALQGEIGRELMIYAVFMVLVLLTLVASWRRHVLELTLFCITVVRAGIPDRRYDQPSYVELLAVAQLCLLAVTLNVWVLVGILTAAFAVQFWLGEPPCPLCVMQRIAFALVGLGLLHILLRAYTTILTTRLIAAGQGMAVHRGVARSPCGELPDLAAYPARRSGLRLACVRHTSLYVVFHRIQLSDCGKRHPAHYDRAAQGQQGPRTGHNDHGGRLRNCRRGQSRLGNSRSWPPRENAGGSYWISPVQIGCQEGSSWNLPQSVL